MDKSLTGKTSAEGCLFHCRRGMKIFYRDAGTDICLRCPLPDDYCVNGDVRHKNVRYKFKRVPPICLVAFTSWHNVPFKTGEALAHEILNQDDPDTADLYKSAIKNLAKKRD